MYESLIYPMLEMNRQRARRRLAAGAEAAAWFLSRKCTAVSSSRTTASFWRKLVAFAGPGFLVAVGYMDPGNWATDLAGGAQVWLHAALRRPDLEPDGDPAPASVRQARHRHRARSRPGLPRSLFEADRHGFSGSSANWPSRRAIWPKSSARPSRCNCSSAFRSSGVVVITAADVLAVLFLQNRLPLHRSDGRSRSL